MSKAKGDDEELTANDAAVVKGMIARGGHNHHIAAYFGVHQRAVSYIRSGKRSNHITAADWESLPRPGPYAIDPTFEHFHRVITTVDRLWDKGEMKKAKSLLEKSLKTPQRIPSNTAMDDTFDDIMRDDLGRSKMIDLR